MIGTCEGLHFEVHPGQGPHLLLVHGFLASKNQWKANLAGLAGVCTPVTVDLLGHGRSESPEPVEAYHPTAYAQRFEALRAQLGAERWFIGGASFGGGLTLRYALMHPDRVIGQVVTNSLSGLGPSDRGDPADREAQARDLETRGAEALADMDWFPRPSRRLPPSTWQAMVDDSTLLSPTGIARALRGTAPNLSVADDAHHTAVPTLLVNGVKEFRFQPLREFALKTIPDITVADVQGGHTINMDRPDDFDAAVRDFVLRLSAG